WHGDSKDKNLHLAFEGGSDQALQKIVVLDEEKKTAVSVYQSGPENSHSIDVSSEDTISIGRSSSCDIVLGDHQVSGHHLELYRQGNRWGFRDNGSSNGTYLNDRRTNNGFLNDADVLTIGFCRLIITKANLTVIAACSVSSNLVHNSRRAL